MPHFSGSIPGPSAFDCLCVLDAKYVVTARHRIAKTEFAYKVNPRVDQRHAPSSLFQASTVPVMVSRSVADASRWAQVTPRLIFTAITFSWANIMYGLWVLRFLERDEQLTSSDTGSFGSLQALPSWLLKFGTLQANGKHTLPTSRRSIMNSGASTRSRCRCVN